MILTASNIADAVTVLWGGNLTEASSAFRCNVSTLRRWINKGQKPQGRKAGHVQRTIAERAHMVSEDVKRFM